MRTIAVRYADGDGRLLKAEVIFTWTRDDFPHGAFMSISSGPKDYLKNDVWTIFETVKAADTVVMLRAAGPTFFLIHAAHQWFDVTARPVEVQDAHSS